MPRPLVYALIPPVAFLAGIGGVMALVVGLVVLVLALAIALALGAVVSAVLLATLVRELSRLGLEALVRRVRGRSAV